MKQFFTLSLIVLICIGCKKNNPSSVTINEPQDYTVRAIEEENLITKDEVKTLQEIIDNYATSVMKVQRAVVMQIEGNFTGSGNREIIGFYDNPKSLVRQGSIDGVFCFILDSNGENVDNVYAIDYLTWEFIDSRIPKSEMDLSKDLGRPIVWKDRVIGCFGDFNKNGKDELYLFRVSALWVRPYFFEFDGNEFKKIIDINSEDKITISGIDSEKKIIFLKYQTYPEARDNQMYEAIGTYIWDETTQMYKLLSDSELKYFRWNRSLQQFEEINR
jgi:hypothetical protein